MQGRLEQKSQFELIFENLEESLILISKNKMQLVNRQFLTNFSKIIIDAHENIQSNQEAQAETVKDASLNAF